MNFLVPLTQTQLELINLMGFYPSKTSFNMFELDSLTITKILTTLDTINVQDLFPNITDSDLIMSIEDELSRIELNLR